MNRTTVSTVVATLAVVLTTGLAGCSPAQQQGAPAGQPTAAQQPAAEAPADALGAFEQMSPEQKRSELTTDFPLEIPVPVGTVVSAHSQAPDTWDYELEVPGGPVAVRDWYAQAYRQRSWKVVEAGELTQTSPGYYVKLRKNAAESRVDVLGSDDSPTTTVKVVVGIGAPILQTF